MTRLICVSSGKGGVGKTTLTSNLGTALNQFGADTVVMDANLTNANLGFHLGIPLYPTTLHDVLRGDAHITEATYIHESGLRIVPAGLSVHDLKNTAPDTIPEALLDVVGDPDFMLIDCAAGLGREAIHTIEASDELLVVTNPNLPAVTDALKTATVANDAAVHVHGTVLNKVTGQGHELTAGEVEEMIGHDVLAEIPHDTRFEESVAEKTPLLHRHPKSKPAIEVKKLAADLADLDYKPERSVMDILRDLFA